ncbi:MerR family DNA-binding protein [Acidiferrobacter sp.]|uniref:MerR family transcriptional regulator n=1 Tax=Acidiferrobacter sp. TaxID=1872107 RepID=UPI002618E394|nr:MerR family DNA-binding protein [Acidiferrobacter sp.]
MGDHETKLAGMTIGDLAKAAHVSVETVRFYERRGLIKQPPRPYGGIRRYPGAFVRRIQFIKHAKSLGFTLAEIGDMLALSADDPSTCGEVQRLAEDKLALLREKSEALRFMESVLETLLADCRRHSDSPCHCPILEAVEEGIEGPVDRPLKPRA